MGKNIYLVVDSRNRQLLFDTEPKYDKISDRWYSADPNLYYKYSELSDGFDGVYIDCNFRQYINYGVVLPAGSINKLLSVDNIPRNIIFKLKT